MPGYVAAIVVCTVAVAWYAGSLASHYIQETTEEGLRHIAAAMAAEATHLVADGELTAVQAYAESLSKQTERRITIIAADGRVLGESHADPAAMDNHADRPEVIEALATGVGHAIRRSATIDQRVQYIALPLRQEGQVVGIARVAVPMKEVDAVIGRVIRRIIGGGLVAAVLVALLSLVVYRRHIARPLHDLQVGARRFAHGRLEQTLRVADTEEIGSLAEALNQMGRQLSEQMQTVRQQASEREAILASMTEGVLAVDPQQVIISLNRTAAQQLGVEAATAPGRGIAEVVRNAPLLRFVARVMKSNEPIEGEINLSRPGATRTLAASGTALRNLDGTRIGAVVVLNDITRLRELEGLRQQFVANVSHELKTPISAIKAGVETLLDSDDQTPGDPAATSAAAKRFLPMIARQAERLNAIVEDLLTLARLEQDTAETPVPLEPMRLLPVLRGAAETVGAKAEARQQTLSMEVEPELAAIGNDTLLGQAVVNLLDNAIKYSPPGEPILLAARRIGPEVVVEVTDRGPGIEPQHIPRLFERFYRTDKARSRDQGGTGLGLSIVKHVAQTLGGQVTVESEVGHGSTFRIHLVAAGTLNTVPAN